MKFFENFGFKNFFKTSSTPEQGFKSSGRTVRPETLGRNGLDRSSLTVILPYSKIMASHNLSTRALLRTLGVFDRPMAESF